jgi:hypothetical protein
VEPDNMQTTRRMFIRTTAATTAAFAAAPLALGRVRTDDPKPAADATAKPAANKLKILILGGTAFLGPELVETAQARGHALTLFNRGKTRPNLFPDVEKLRGDRDPNKGEGLKALEGDRTWDAVIDTSGDYRAWSRPAPICWRRAWVSTYLSPRSRSTRAVPSPAAMRPRRRRLHAAETAASSARVDT